MYTIGISIFFCILLLKIPSFSFAPYFFFCLYETKSNEKIKNQLEICHLFDFDFQVFFLLLICKQNQESIAKMFVQTWYVYFKIS